MGPVIGILAVVIVFGLIILLAAIKIVQEYERGVVFRLGRIAGVRGPGLILLSPFIERMVKVDLRTVTMDIPSMVGPVDPTVRRQECERLDGGEPRR